MKEAGVKEIIREMSKYGRIVLVASDTRPSSHFVKKIAAVLKARLFYPRSSLTREEKRITAGEMPDDHTRDAYAAALKAYHRFENRLRRLKKLGYDDQDRSRIIMGKRAKS